MKLAGEEGFEPSQSDPESDVLPLDDSPTDATSIADYSKGLHVCKGLSLTKSKQKRAQASPLFFIVAPAKDFGLSKPG